jgi:ComF family protein
MNAPTGWIYALGGLASRAFGLSDLLFPRRCAWCDADLSQFPALLPDERLCPDCPELLLEPEPPRCRRCGATMPAVPTDSCEWCNRHKLRFDAVLPLGGYAGPLHSAVLRMNAPTGTVVAAAMAGLLCRRLGDRLAAMEPQVVIPVPMHWSRRARRGFNSSDILAQRLARHLERPLLAGAVLRRRNTALQRDLPPSGRFRNVRGAFTLIANYDFTDARVLLVDDILTTGATCGELAGILKRAGAGWVGVAVVARAEGLG